MRFIYIILGAIVWACTLGFMFAVSIGFYACLASLGWYALHSVDLVSTAVFWKGALALGLCGWLFALTATVVVKGASKMAGPTQAQQGDD